MISIYDYIVKIDEKEVSEYKTDSGVKIYRNTADTFDGFAFSRSGVVHCDITYNRFNAKVGDRLIFHHNMVNEWFDHEGKKVVSKFLVDEDELLYRIPPSECYGYWRNDKFTAVGDWIFVEPIDEKKLHSDIIETLSEESKYKAKVLYSSSLAKELGIDKGTIIVFNSEDCKIPFPLLGDSKTIWRMSLNWILAIINES